MEITEEMIKKCFFELRKISKLKNAVELRFDTWCSEYFDIDDFSTIYANHDEIVDPLVYGDGTISWNEFVKVVEKYKEEIA